MKIEIVHPAHYRDDGSLVQAKGWVDKLHGHLPHLGPPLLAALTPAEHEVRLVEEYVEDVDLDSHADLIALSGQIMQFGRCRDLAIEYRKRGKKVVLGGYLPSMLPERVVDLFDAIVSGEGDEVWPELLEDAKRGCLKRHYRASRPVDLTKLPVPRYDMIKKDRVIVYPVQATRGCPFTCQYCSIAAVFKGGHRKRPVDDVVRDVRATKSRWINFCDDNLCEDVRYAEKLFDALRGAPIRWGTQTTINVARHPELLKKARDSGCALMALGAETLSAKNLEEVDKTFFAVDRYAEAFLRIKDAGISPHALIIFGLPEDRPDVFQKTVEYLEKLGIPIALFFILTPYPGTPTGDQIHREERVFDRDLSHLREPYVVYEPRLMSATQLKEGWWKALEDFYSLKSIARRVVFAKHSPNRFIDSVTNLSYWLKVKRGIHPVYFGN